jgi:activator of the mannose operon (transcriptional antiterminator)
MGNGDQPGSISFFYGVVSVATDILLSKLRIDRNTIHVGGVLVNKYFDKIVIALNSNEAPITAAGLARQLGVSTKTVYRAVEDINQYFGQPVIASQRGLGYKLNYSLYSKLVNQSKKEQLVSYSPVERRNQVISSILFSAPFAKSIQNMYQPYYVSDDSIHKDLVEINKTLNQYGIKLETKNGMVSASGNEEIIRRAINEILINSGAMGQESVSEFADQFEDINIYDRHFLNTQLTWIKRRLETDIPYPYNVNIFSHLYILIKRFRSGKVHENGRINTLTAEQLIIIKNNQNFFKIASDVIKNISDYLHDDLPEIEKYYLFQYLISMRYVHDLAFEGKVSNDVLKIVDFYIEAVQQNPQDGRVKTLRNDLIGHVKPMLNRLDHHIVVFNKLLKDIKIEYGELFKKVRAASRQIERNFSLNEIISDDEVGFITLYFANYFETLPRSKKALIMCASGIGTSKLLYIKVHKAFPDLIIEDVISKTDYEKKTAKYTDIDLIITTVDVKPRNHAKVVLSSAIFSKADRKRVDEVVNNE